MLIDELNEVLSEKIVDQIEKINTEILTQIGKTIKEIGNMTPSQAQQLVNILKYGGKYEEITNEIAKITNKSLAEIDDIFSQVADANNNFSKQFYKYRGMNFIPYAKNEALQQYTKTWSDVAKRTFLNMTNSSTLGYGFQNADGTLTFKGLKETLHDTIDEAVISITQGKTTFQEEMDRVITNMGENGLRTLSEKTYIDKNGVEKHYTRRLDSSVRMYMSDALRDFANDMQLKIGDEIRADGVEISVHANPAPDHAPLQGRQFTMKEFLDIQAGEYGRAIGEYNCYHTVFAVVLGVSKPRYTDEQLQKINNDNKKGFDFDGNHYTNYQGTQLQRKIETEIRKQKDIQIGAVASGSDDLIRKSQQRITQLTTKYKQLSDASGLPTKAERMKVSGYKRVKIKEEVKK